MAWQDDIAEKRREATAVKASKQLHTDQITAVLDSGKGVESATSKLAKSQDIDSLIREVKEVQLASLLGAGKPNVILTDQTDLGDKMTELADKVYAAIKSVDSADTDKAQLAELKSLYVGVSQLNKAFMSGNGDITKGIKLLTQAVNGIVVNPVVNVPAPNVKVEATKVDLKPLQDTLKSYFEVPKVEKIELECYRAQDISEQDGIQYVGFVNPEGNWYIIENDMKGNSLRYVFGTSGYAKAFKKASGYQYRLLNEAINEV